MGFGDRGLLSRRLNRRCDGVSCAGGLVCIAGHPIGRLGSQITFGFSLGDMLVVRTSVIDGAGQGLFVRSFFSTDVILTTYDGHVSHKTMAPDSAYNDRFAHLHAIPRTEYVVWGFRYPVQGRGLGSFANHSSSPNARVCVRKGVFPYLGYSDCPLLRCHLVLQSIRDLHSDDEVTINNGRCTCRRLSIPY